MITQCNPGVRLLLVLLILLSALGRAHAATPGRALVASFTPDAIVAGDQTTLSWEVTGASVGYCATYDVPGGDSFGLPLSGSKVVIPTASVTVLIECEGPIGTTGADWSLDAYASVTVASGPQPPTVNVSLSTDTIQRGAGASILRWTSQYATTCSSGDIAGVSGTSGSLTITAPPADPSDPSLPPPKTYKVTCTGPAGTADGSATLTVLQGGTAQVVIFAGTGGVRLETAPVGPLRVVQPVWFDFLPTGTLLEPFPFLRNWTDFLSYYMALRPSPDSDPDVTVPVSGHPPVQVVHYADLDDGLGGSGCLSNYIGPLCLKPYLADMVSALRAAGIDVKIINYDWRQAWSRHYPLIRQVVDEAFARGKYEKVYFVGHSQGTALAKSFLIENPEYRSKVALNFNLGGVLLGTPAATRSNTARTGGTNFGIWQPPFMLQNVTGLRIGGYAPATYHMNPSRELIDIVHHNTGEWIFADYSIQNGVSTRLFPLEDTVQSAQQYMKSLAISQTLFDRGVDVQEELAANTHGVPSYQIMNPDIPMAGGWISRSYSPSPMCGAGCQTVRHAENVLAIPADGTAPTVSSLGRFSGGPSRGILRIDGRTEHQDLVKDPQALDFMVRAIRIDRGWNDPSFAADHPLMTDDEMLTYVGWSLPPAYGPVASRRSTAPAAAISLSSGNVIEFSTSNVEATVTLTVTNLKTLEERVYRATKAGVELVSPVAPPEDTATEIRLNFSSDDSAVPVLTATSARLFRDSFGDDAGIPDDAVAGDLSGLDLHVPTNSDPCEVRITADRDIAGLVRVSGPQTSGVKVVMDAGIQTGESLRYLRNDTTASTGILYRDTVELPMVDDVQIH